MKNFTEHKLLPCRRLFYIGVVKPLLEYENVLRGEESYQRKNLTSNNIELGKCLTFVTYIKSHFYTVLKQQEKESD